MSEFKEYKRKSISEMRPYVVGEDLTNVSISEADTAAGSPKEGDMIARNPKNHNDQWLVARQYFIDNLEEIGTEGKSYQNTTADRASKNVKDIVFWGDGDMFKLISKAHSKNEKWMKSTKAMEIPGVGCLVQVTTQQGDNVAEALTMVPGVYIHSSFNNLGEVIGRSLIGDTYAAGERFLSSVFTKDNETYRAVKAFGDTVTLELLNPDGSGNPMKRMNIYAGELEVISRKAAEVKAQSNKTPVEKVN